MQKSCELKTLKKYKERPSPPYAASQCEENLVLLGNDGNQYIVRKASNGVHRWVRHHKTSGASAAASKTQKKETKLGDYAKLTVAALKALLTKQKIAFPSKAKKADLVQLAKGHGQKWYLKYTTPKRLNEVVGYQAFTQKDVTLQKVLDNFSSRQEYQNAKRGQDALAGYEIVGKNTKYYLQEYPF